MISVSAHAGVTTGRRGFLQGLAGLAVAPSVGVDSVFTATQQTTAAVAVEFCQFPVSAAEMALAWRSANVCKSYPAATNWLDTWLVFAKTNLLENHELQQAAQELREAFSVATNNKTLDYHGDSEVSVAITKLRQVIDKLNKAQVNLPLPDESDQFKLLIEMEDEVAQELDIPIDQIFRATYLLQMPIEILKDGFAIPEKLDLIHDALVTKLRLFSPNLAYKLKLQILRQSSGSPFGVGLDPIYKLIGFSDRQEDQAPIRYDVNDAPFQLQFLLKPGETIRDRAQAYIRKIIKLEEYRVRVSKLPSSRLRDGILAEIRTYITGMKDELRTLPLRLRVAKEIWDARPDWQKAQDSTHFWMTRGEDLSGSSPHFKIADLAQLPPSELNWIRYMNSALAAAGSVERFIDELPQLAVTEESCEQRMLPAPNQFAAPINSVVEDRAVEMVPAAK